MEPNEEHPKEPKEPLHILIGFRSGNELRFDCDAIRVAKSQVTHQVTSISYDGGPELFYMSLSDIEYIVTDPQR